MNYRVIVEDAAKEALAKMDASVRSPILKRMKRMPREPPGRHLQYGLPFFIIDVGQYRIAYSCVNDLKRVYLIGDHKDYQRWLRSLQRE